MRVALGHAIPAPGANTNIFTALTPSDHASAWRMQISLATGAVVNLRVTDGSTAYTQALFDGATLTAGRLYIVGVSAQRVTVEVSLRGKPGGICVDPEGRRERQPVGRRHQV